MKKIFISLIAFAFFSCENIIYPELEPSLEQYVVDAWLNDLPGSQKIFLSKSNNYFMSELPKLLSGAEAALHPECRKGIKRIFWSIFIYVYIYFYTCAFMCVCVACSVSAGVWALCLTECVVCSAESWLIPFVTYWQTYS